jgi:hypothetical protein
VCLAPANLHLRPVCVWRSVPGVSSMPRYQHWTNAKPAQDTALQHGRRRHRPREGLLRTSWPRSSAEKPPATCRPCFSSMAGRASTLPGGVLPTRRNPICPLASTPTYRRMYSALAASSAQLTVAVQDWYAHNPGTYIHREHKTQSAEAHQGWGHPPSRDSPAWFRGNTPPPAARQSRPAPTCDPGTHAHHTVEFFWKPARLGLRWNGGTVGRWTGEPRFGSSPACDPDDTTWCDPTEWPTTTTKTTAAQGISFDGSHRHITWAAGRKSP